MTLRERELFNVGELRRSLVRLNAIGLAAPVTFADIVVTTHTDGSAADINDSTPQARPALVVAVGPPKASISSRLPVWGRGAVHAIDIALTAAMP